MLKIPWTDIRVTAADTPTFRFGSYALVATIPACHVRGLSSHGFEAVFAHVRNHLECALDFAKRCRFKTARIDVVHKVVEQHALVQRLSNFSPHFFRENAILKHCLNNVFRYHFAIDIR